MKKIIVVLLLLTIVGTLFTACTQENANEQSDQAIQTVDEQSEIEESISEESDEKIIIRYAARSESGNIQVARDKMFAEFEKQFPNIIVEREELPHADFWVKMPAAIASGDGPDVIELPYLEQGVTFAAKGLLAPLDSFMDGSNGIDRNDLIEEISGFGVYGGDTLLLPIAVMTTGLGYNIDMFDAAGVDYPTEDWTWDDMLNAALRLTLDANGNSAESEDFDPENIVQWGIYTWWWNSDFDLYMWTFGGDWLSEDGKSCNLDSPEVLEALTFYGDLTQKYHVAPYVRELAPAHGHPALMDSKVAMAFVDVGNIKLVDESGINWDIAPVPYKEDVGVRAAFMYGNGIGILADSEKKEAAWELVKFLQSSGMDPVLAEEGYGFPPYSSEYDVLDFSPMVDVLYQMVEDGWVRGIMTSDYQGVIVDPANIFIAGALTKGEYPDYQSLLEQANTACNVALQEAPELP